MPGGRHHARNLTHWQRQRPSEREAWCRYSAESTRTSLGRPACRCRNPEGMHRPTIDYPPTKIHVFRTESFPLGRLEVNQEQGERFWITDPERTVADVFGLRHLVGEQLALGALRRYLQAAPKTAQLMDTARQLRVSTPLGAALRVLQE